MRWTDQATCRPYRCAVNPFIGNGSGHVFLDTGQDLDLEHVYIADVSCEQIAQELGWVPPQVLEQAKREIANLEGQIELLEAEREEADKFADAAEYTLGKFGSKVRQKPGRKAQKEKVA